MLPPLPISADEVRERLGRGERVAFLDTRSPDDWDAAATQIEGALRFRPSEIENHLRFVPQGCAIVTYCDCPDGASSTRAAAALVENGWRDVHPLRRGEWRRFPTAPRGEARP
ncbi:MAG TPA: rhodanese-like domain-containing protein [Bryobacteraceae bacterium]|jgi:rhodanese-related sulfurtransferase|nr:rhodanese-like domain-containing protein [Bryobacteraceae bacterium]